jgi:hypothetical protein
MDFSADFYGCETWLLVGKEERREQVTETIRTALCERRLMMVLKGHERSEEKTNNLF